jgi:hypothetical protein
MMREPPALSDSGHPENERDRRDPVLVAHVDRNLNVAVHFKGNPKALVAIPTANIDCALELTRLLNGQFTRGKADARMLLGQVAFRNLLSYLVTPWFGLGNPRVVIALATQPKPTPIASVTLTNKHEADYIRNTLNAEFMLQ